MLLKQEDHRDTGLGVYLEPSRTIFWLMIHKKQRVLGRALDPPTGLCRKPLNPKLDLGVV